MDDVESELIVDAEHTTIHMTGKTIFEVRRILLEHLQSIDSEDRVAQGEHRIAQRDDWSAPSDQEQESDSGLVPTVIER